MKIQHTVYNDDVIEVQLLAEDKTGEEARLFYLGIRYLEPGNYRKNDKTIEITNVMGGETELFILPHTFGIAIGKKLIEQKSAGLKYFDEQGFEKLLDWLIEMEEIDDAMCY